MPQEELLKIGIRSSAMETAVAWYCCHHGNAEDEQTDPVNALNEQVETLLRLRDMFVSLALRPSPDL